MAYAGVSVEVFADWAPLPALLFALASILKKLGSLGADQTVAWQHGCVALASLTVELLAVFAGLRAEELTFAWAGEKTVSIITGLITSRVALASSLVKCIMLRALQQTISCARASIEVKSLTLIAGQIAS